jgi:hypothetical protein
MLTVLCSGKGAPGVTTFACIVGALWPESRPVVVAECDPSGNDLAARFGLSPRLGMTSLVLAVRSGGQDARQLDVHVQALPGGLETLVGPCHPEAARLLDREIGGTGSSIFPGGVDVLVDCGRIIEGSPGQGALLAGADRVLVIGRTDAASLVHSHRIIDRLRPYGGHARCSFVAVGSSPFGAQEIERALDTDIAATIPIDHGAASIVCGVPGRPKTLARSGIVNAAKDVVGRLLEGRRSAGVAAPPPPPRRGRAVEDSAQRPSDSAVRSPMEPQATNGWEEWAR